MSKIYVSRALLWIALNAGVHATMLRRKQIIAEHRDSSPDEPFVLGDSTTCRTCPTLGVFRDPVEDWFSLPYRQGDLGPLSVFASSPTEVAMFNLMSDFVPE